jgi:hypothetical protein
MIHCSFHGGLYFEIDTSNEDNLHNELKNIMTNTIHQLYTSYLGEFHTRPIGKNGY